VSALADGSAELAKALAGEQMLSIPVIVIGEFRFGILGSRHRARYDAWLTALLEVCRLLPIELSTAERYATIRHDLKRRGRPIPSNDVWVAALAIEHALPVVSRDEHFDSIADVSRIGW